MLYNQLDRGNSGVLENQLVRNKSGFSDNFAELIRFNSYGERRTSEAVVKDVVKSGQGLVVFIDDNFINH